MLILESEKDFINKWHKMHNNNNNNNQKVKKTIRVLLTGIGETCDILQTGRTLYNWATGDIVRVSSRTLQEVLATSSLKWLSQH